MKEKMMIKRITAIVLSAAMILSGVFVLPLESNAADISGDPDAVKGVYYTYYGRVVGPHVYSDELFAGDSTDFNYSVASASITMCLASLRSNRTKDGLVVESSRPIREYLTDNGFTDFEASRSFDENDGDTINAVAVARKTIVDNGEKYTLLAIAPRGATTDSEWKTTFDMGENGDFAAYAKGRDMVLEFTRDYIRDKKISGNVKIWTSGFSRGAGIDNLVAAAIVDDPMAALGVNVKRGDIYCYLIGTPRVTTDRKCKASRYDCIHTIIEHGDIYANFPIIADGFDRYGTEYFYAQNGEDTGRMLEYLKGYRESDYEYYIENDPDEFYPRKLDLEGLLQGNLSFVDDDDSYITKDRGEYLEDLTASFSRSIAGSVSGDKSFREVFSSKYQEGLMRFADAVVYYDFSVDTLTGGTYGIPMLLSMYLTNLVESAVNGTTESINETVEETFNRIALIVEDEDGNVLERFANAESYYLQIRDTYFTGDHGCYELRYSIKGKSLLVKALRNLTGMLYAGLMRENLTGKADEEYIAEITKPENSVTTAYALTCIFFGCDAEGGKARPMKLDSGLKAMATLLSNLNRLSTLHGSDVMTSWIAIYDPYYIEYEADTDAQRMGYRRVYIGQPDSANIAGSVIDGNGDTVAEFRNGRITSRTDDWVGMTTCDTGNWLRLPMENSYKVVFSNDRDCSSGLKIEEYSPYYEEVRREVVKSDWKSISLEAGSKVEVSVPAIKAGRKGYDLPSQVDYSMTVTGPAAPPAPSGDSPDASGTMEVVRSSAITAVKSVSAKAGRKSITVKWKKPSAKKLKKYSRVEIQYSTDPDFRAGTTRVKEVSKTKRSYKIKKLAAKNTYYVRLRNIRYSYNKKYVSGWSKVKKVKVK